MVMGKIIIVMGKIIIVTGKIIIVMGKTIIATDSDVEDGYRQCYSHKQTD